MGCANEKLHAQQIAYQRDFLGACWNSVLGEDEAKEYLASRWMGISRQVMGLCTNNHCFTVHTLRKEKTAATDPSKAPGDLIGARPGVGGNIGVGSSGRQRTLSVSVGASPNAGSPPASPNSSTQVINPSLLCAPASRNFPKTTRHGQSGSSDAPYLANADAELSAANARVAAAGKTKRADSGTLRTVMKDAIQLEKAAHSQHPYLQRHELSVYSGVVFRCAPAHRLYHRISFVPEARAKRLNDAPVSAAAGAREDQQPASTLPSTPPSTSSGRAVKHSPLCEGDGGPADGMPALQLGSTLAWHTISSGADWEADDPLSASNNYPIEDRDVDGVAATRPPVIVGSITAMELQALPPNAELCFGGWLYVSLQDEQERLRRSLARYEKRRQRRAAAREATITSSPIASSTWPTPSTFCKDSLSPGQSPGGRPYNSVNGGTVEDASDGGKAPHLRTSVVARSMSAPRRPWQRRDSSDEMITRSQRPTAAAAAAPPSPLGVVQEDTPAPPRADVSRQLSPNEGLGDAVIADAEDAAHTTAPMVDTTSAAEAASSRADGKEEEGQPVQHTPQLSATQSEKRAAPAMKTATALPPPQSQPSLAIARPLNLSCNLRSAAASSARNPSRTTGESHKRVISLAPQQPTPMLGVSPLSPLRCTGKYAQEAMEAEALVASWLPYAYVVIAVPMYECSLVPTAFHTALIRRKAVSLNLADAQSRQAYGVGCITAARYGGVMVVEYREKISEDDDAEWIDELLRVGRASQEKYGEAGAKPDGMSTLGLSASAAAGTSTPSVRHLSRTVAHHARAEKLHRIKSCIWHKLRRQGLYVILASTCMADRRHRQQRAFVASELSRVFQASASWLGTPATSVSALSKGRKSRHSAALAACASETAGDAYEDVDGIGCDYYAADMNGVVDYDSLDDNSDSCNSRTGRASQSSNGSIGASEAARSGGESGGRRHSLWSKLSLPGGSKNHWHRRRHHYHGSRGGGDGNAERKKHDSTHFGLSGQQRDGSGRRGPTAANPSLWAEPNYDNDFLLRGTYRQIGGMKYLDVVALIDGCPVSELVQGIKRWVVNLLSMPIKARPLCLYLQRYEGIASSLQLLSTQVASAALASSVASGHLIAPMNLSFRAGGGAGLEAASFVSQQHAEATGGATSTGSFSAASVLMNVSATASTARRNVPYNTYYRGPLDPVVRAVMSPEVESMIAACHTRQLPEVLRSPQLPAPRAVTSDGATDAGPLPPLPSPASVASRGSCDDPRSSSGRTSLTPQFLPSLSSSDAKRAVSVEARVGIAAQVLCSPRLSTRSPATPRTGRPLCADPGPSPSTSAVRLQRKEQHETPAGSAAVQSSTAHVDPTSASLLPSAPPPAALSLRTADTAPPKHSSAGPPLEASECPLCNDSLQNDSAVGHSCTATNGKALAAAAAAAATASVVPGDSIGNPTGDGITNGSAASPTVIDPLTAPSLLQDGWKQRGTSSSRSNCFSAAASKGGATGDDTRPDDNACTGPRSMLDHTRYPGQRSLPERSEPMGAAAAAGCCNSSGDDDASDDGDRDAAARQKAGGTACAGAEEEEVSYGEREWQLADRELRALKLELDEMRYLVSTAHSELLQRLEESSQLGAIFLPHTRPDQVDLSLLTLKMMRQYPEEVPVKEIHTDWVPMLMSLLTISRDNLFCGAGAGDDGGDTLDFLRTYNNAVTQSDACDADKRRELYDAGTAKYTIDPLPPLPAPRPLHDIVIAPQPIRFTKEMLREVKRVGMDETGLSFAFSGGSLGVLAGVLYYYTDFLRAKYCSGVAAAGRWPKDAGATVQDVLARDGYNVVLRRIWIWGVIPDSSERKSGITSAAAKTKQLLRGKLRRRDRADSATSTESTSTRCAEDANYVVMNTTGLDGGGARVRGQPFRSTEAYALYDAVLHYLRTLEEFHTEHHGNDFIAPQGAMKRRSALMAWRRNKGCPDAAAAACGNGGEPNGAAGSAAAASPATWTLVPKFEICVATNYYYKELMEEARQPRTPARRSSSLLYTSGSLHHTPSETSRCKRLSAAVPPPPAASSSAASGTINAAKDGRKVQATIPPPPPPAGSAGSHAKVAKEVVAKAQQHVEQPYCGGEETVRRKAPQRHAVKKIFGFLTEHYEQWRAQHSDDPAANALAKRIHISTK
ncbi:hypothetical protein LMJF_16_1240 [Leishmania major strain Friedlin]|uniref:Uncharacterized protein n=1 Tax=Leishmania major TaxID=5664 RepID=Q4QEP3_LEIMA|nr:hypothetical protein LMJF_16_1240 [Leishmania major strain Friedlin]CAG9572165.1 hypothetical_protein_-_conserved [Leishmania major strain Friedlin]CAJ03948.1 hypothetical protein LMJF_16_1240 [Leishmania major strain Friedlin]|eukprot:XP_001682205.1 hypothetical protein LMJF_16_1240 [Leishmania major strain Friedlin]